MRLAANAGFDSEGNPTASADPAEWENKGYAAEEYFHERLRDDALVSLTSAGMVEILRVWEADGRLWRRVSREAIFEIAHDPDAVGHLYVDREEFETILLRRHPSNTASLAEEAAISKSDAQEELKRGPGRPRKPMYGQQVALLIAEMKVLIESGKASSPHNASLKVAEKTPGGGTPMSKARRLRDAYKAAEENGV